MKIQRHKPQDAATERHILISMIISDDVCRSIRKSYENRFFVTKITKEVAKWCMDFYDSYEAAPKQDIQSIFEMKVKAGAIDPDLSDEIEKFLESISEEYEEFDDNEGFNVQFYVELTQKYFKKRSFILLAEEIRQAADNDDIDTAEKTYTNYTKVQEQQDTSRKLLEDSGIESLRISVESRPPVLFQMPGALGQMMGPIERETFYGILGREKAGKTYHLMMFALAAAKQGLKVAMFETGDLTQDQLDSRFASAFTGKTYREDKAGKYYIPVLDCMKNQMGMCDKVPSKTIVSWNEQYRRHEFLVDVKDPHVIKEHDPCIECFRDRRKRKKFEGSVWWQKRKIDQWSWGEVKEKIKAFKRRFKGEIITEAFPMHSMKMSDVRAWIINRQKQDGFLPDVLLIDYPDIMLPESDREFRHQENEKWMNARKISQEFHNCVMVATQANAKAYSRDSLKLDNYSEDKRKYGHTTHFYAINKTENEELMGCSRFGALILREDVAQISKQVTILQELPTSRPYITSFFGRMPNLKI